MRRTVAALACCCLTLVGCSGTDKDGVPGNAEHIKSEPVDAMVDVGERKLHVVCRGSGSPTVILEAGLNGDHRTWDQVVPAVARATRVCVYDRANIDPSEPAPKPRSAQNMVADLRALLEAADEDGPYVLVGFSFGGLITQLFASTYPKDTVGLVLVESNHPDEVEQFEAELTKQQIAEDRQIVDANDEGADVYESFKEVQAAPPLPDCPLVVITAGKPEDWPPGWDVQVFSRLRAAQQKDLLGLVSDATQIIARQSGHDVPLSEPEIVVEGIETVLAKVD